MKAKQVAFVLSAVFALTMHGCERDVSVSSLDAVAADIFAGEIQADVDGTCEIEAKNNVVDDIASVTTANGTKMILFRTWRGKGSNLRGILYTNGLPLPIGGEIELISFCPSGPDGGPAIGPVAVSIDSAITKTCYRVSRSLD